MTRLVISCRTDGARTHFGLRRGQIEFAHRRRCHACGITILLAAVDSDSKARCLCVECACQQAARCAALEEAFRTLPLSTLNYHPSCTTGSCDGTPR